MNYELFMGEALAEARVALSAGERPNAAVAVVHDAMVARAHDRVQVSNDPTAHAVVVALREAARKLGTARLAEATIFATMEPCAMCVGALLESDVEALVFACPNVIDGAAGTVLQLAQHAELPRKLRLVTGIRRDEAEELFADAAEAALAAEAAHAGRSPRAGRTPRGGRSDTGRTTARTNGSAGGHGATAHRNGSPIVPVAEGASVDRDSASPAPRS